MITPAISVLSAIEGLKSINEDLGRYVVPITMVILFCLFAVQSRGTEALGKAFGPIMLGRVDIQHSLQTNPATTSTKAA